jgi:hypothetical protein
LTNGYPNNKNNNNNNKKKNNKVKSKPIELFELAGKNRFTFQDIPFVVKVCKIPFQALLPPR